MVQLYQSSTREFTEYEQVDCRDENGVWMNGEVIEIKPDQIKVHFSGFARKFDAWISTNPDNVVKQWRFGNQFYLNQRIDVRDTMGKWLEARVVDLNDKQIKVHYRGFKDIWDEWINVSSDRIAEIGSKSKAFGVGKFDPNRISRFNAKEVQEFVSVFNQFDNKEALFKELLAEAGLEVFPIEGDGNCMFRSVSHQLYGSSQHHAVIRAKTLEYMRIEREYFANFIDGGLERFDEYIEYMSRNGAWGDDTEIQAMSEMYDRPFYIYAYSATPMRTFHEVEGSLPPIKVSYHGKCHYNSVVNTVWHEPLLPTPPGQFEEEFIRNHQARLAAGGVNMHLNSMRQAFDQRGQLDLEEAIRLSLDEMGSSLDGRVSAPSSIALHDDQLLTQAINASRQDWMSPHGGDDELQIALALSTQPQPHEIEDELQIALAMSAEQETLSPAVREALDAGFSLEAAQNAVMIVGDVPDLVIEFLCSSLV